MKIFLILLFSLSLFAFEGKKLYQCAPKYRILNSNPYEFSPEEQKKNAFQVVFSKNLNRVKTSDGMIYTASSSNLKGKLYMNKKKINGRSLTYKLKMATKNGMYRSVFVTGYGNLINEFVMCYQVKTKSKKKKNLSEENTSK